MKRSTSFAPKAPFSLAAYIPAMILLAVTFALLGWAFVQPELSADQRTMANFFFALVSGSAVFLWGGMALSVNGQLGSHMRIALKALGGSAAFTLALLHPLFPPLNAAQPQPSPPVKQLQVVSPAPHSTVGLTVKVNGLTSYKFWNHYIVVRGKTGPDAVQDHPLTVSSSGELSGRATIGDVTVGLGDEYLIWIIATKTTLRPGVLVPPHDAINSEAVPVTRAERSDE